MKKSKFDAIAANLGFHYQALAALENLWLADFDGADDDVILFYEKDDDFKIEYLDRSKFYQVKWSENPKPITDLSPQIWKTLRIWIKLERSKTLSENRYILFTTSPLAPNCSLKKLSDGLSDPAATRKGLVASAAKANEKLPAKSRTRQLRESVINSGHLLAVLKATTVLQSQQDIQQMEARLRGHLGMVPVDNREACFNELLGWWFHSLHTFLTTNIGISLGTFREFLGNLIKRYQSEQSVERPDIELEELDLKHFESSNFIRQLELISQPSFQKLRAIYDFQLAYLNQIEWLFNGSIQDSDLNSFNAKLRRRWHRIRTQFWNDLDPTEAELVDQGKDTYHRILGHSESLLDIHDQEFTQGSYEILSDSMVLGWHPQWNKRLRLGEDE